MADHFNLIQEDDPMQAETTLPKPTIRTKTTSPKPRPRQRTMFTEKELDRYRKPGTVQRRLFDQI